MFFSGLPEKVPGQSRLGRVLRFPLRFIPRAAVLPVCSGINKGMKWIVGSSTHGCWLGTYENTKQAIIRQFVKPGMVVYDIGANAGFYTIAFARLVGSNGRVLAFEPLAAKIEYLLAHVAMNDLVNVHVIQAAVAEGTGLANLEVTSDRSMGVLVNEGRYSVPTVSLDQLIESGAVPEPDLIKMDIEGAEGVALDGARKLLEQRRAAWFVACHSAEQRQKCLMLLQKNRYRIFYMDGIEHRGLHLDRDEIYALPQ